MHCRPKRLIYIQTIFFLDLPHLLLKIFFDLKVKLKKLALFLSLEDNAEYKRLKPTLNRETPYAMCPNRLIFH